MAIQAGGLNGDLVSINRALLALSRDSEKIISECKSGSIALHTLVASRQASLRNSLSTLNALDSTENRAAYESIYNNAFTFSTELASLNTLVNSLVKYITANVSKDVDSDVKFLYLDSNDVLQQRESTDSKFLSDIQSRAQAISDAIMVS